MPLRAIRNNITFLSKHLTEENRSDVFKCPHCHTTMIPVLPKSDIIKHFRHKNKCKFEATERESPEHLEMKEYVKEMLEKDNVFSQIDTEWRIGNKIVDIGGILSNGEKIAIECQKSQISLKEFRLRNTTYTSNGYGTLWIFYSKKLAFSSDDSEVKISKVWKEASFLYYNRLFAYHPSTGCFVVRFGQVERFNEGCPWGDNDYLCDVYGWWPDYVYTLKTIKRVIHRRITSYSVSLFENKNTILATFLHNSFKKNIPMFRIVRSIAEWDEWRSKQ